MEKVILVDKQDNKIWLIEKLEAHKKGLLHRAFSLFIFNDKKELLIQQRAKEKYHCWWLWTNTVCSHQRDWENTINASKRRIKEEMWFSCKNPKIKGFIIYKTNFKNWLIENEYDYVLVWNYSWEEIKPNPDEVMNYKWINLLNLKKEIKLNPNKYTPWMKIIINKNIINNF